MTKREKFIEEIENHLHSEGGIHLSPEAKSFFDELKNGKGLDTVLTEMGEKVLTWIRDNTQKDVVLFSAKAIGEGLFLSSRIVSGATRKLVNDGYLYKEGKNPVSYGITQEGCQILPERE